jgi:plastocyanin
VSIVSKRLVAVAVLAGALFLGACGDDEPETEAGADGGGGSSSIEVTASDIAFDSTSFEVPAGAEVAVTLTNEDDPEHSFSIEDPEFEIEAHGGESAEGTFTAPDSGTLEFFCKYHPDAMRGEITVTG